MQASKKIKCLIIDDEPPAREILRKHVAEVELLELTGECSNAVEALYFLQNHEVDLLFLDIHMPHILGTSFIRTLKNPPKVVFTTAYREYAVEGFDLNAVDYLLKPISFERFLQSVNKVMQVNIPSSSLPTARTPDLLPQRSHPFLYFRCDRRMLKVYLDDIVYIESLKDYVKVVTLHKAIVTKQPISSLEEMLPKESFIRIHRSYIVAIHKIDYYGTDTIGIGKQELPIGRLFRHDVNKLLNDYSMNTQKAHPGTGNNAPGTV